MSSAPLYRNLLRAQRKCFGADLRMINASREEARRCFRENKMTVKEGEEILKVFQQNVAQATKTTAEGHYRLEIRKDLEINEFIPPTKGCCSGNK